MTTETTLHSLDSTTLLHDPWHHALLDRALDPALAASLAASFPTTMLTRSERLVGDKTYRFGRASLPLRVPAAWPGGRWAEFLETLASREYRAAIGRLTGLALDTAGYTVDLWEYETGDWLAPHVDKAEKVVTQIFYLTTGWKRDHGGRLLILDGPDRTRQRAAHVPLLGSSAVLVRSDGSWHAVESPSPRAPKRRSLTATFWRRGGIDDAG